MSRAPCGVKLGESRPLRVLAVLRARDDHRNGATSARELDVIAGLDRVENGGEIRASLGDRVALHPRNVHLDVHLRYRELVSAHDVTTREARPHSRAQPYAVPDS